MAVLSTLFKRAITARSPVAKLVVSRSLATVTDKSFTISSPPQAPYAHRISEPTPAALQLKSGEIFQGTSFGADISVSGEAVFTTSVVGYPESMTDPSYRGQILVFTQPLIGMFSLCLFYCI
jgi:hypothetical protein